MRGAWVPVPGSRARVCVGLGRSPGPGPGCAFVVGDTLGEVLARVRIISLGAIATKKK